MKSMAQLETYISIYNDQKSYQTRIETPIYSSGSALVDQLSYMLWSTSYYLNKYSWYTINQGRSHHFEILPNEHRNSKYSLWTSNYDTNNS